METIKTIPIYNLTEAYYYIENGIKPVLEPKINDKTGKVYITFNRLETKELYNNWCNRNNKY